MHNQSEIDAANRLLRELREIDTEGSHIDVNDLDPLTLTLAMPEAANDDAAIRGDRAHA